MIVKLKYLLYLILIQLSVSWFAYGQSASLPFGKDTTRIIRLLKNINTTKPEISPVIYNGNLVFAAAQAEDLTDGDSEDRNKTPYLDIFTAEKTNTDFKKPRSFSSKINSSFHDCHVTFNKAGTELYLTRIDYVNKKTRAYTNKSRLLIFTKNGNSWSQPVSFKYNDESYSVGQASVSKDDQLLFFVSDMPGGYGGKDIYFCEWNGTEWGKPVNLGPGVNTPADEEYPSIRDDGSLCFSSNGHEGLGGFDFFMAQKDASGKWKCISSNAELLNSTADDFGITFTDPLHGYFVSNRTGGAGREDIYEFNLPLENLKLFATVLLTRDLNNPAKNVLLYYVNARGKKLDSVRTDANGRFQLKNLPADKSYMISVSEDDPVFSGKTVFYLANEENKIVSVSRRMFDKKFVFKNLPVDVNTLPDLVTDEDLTIAGRLTYGNKGDQFVKNMLISIRNTMGDIVDTTHTDDFGSFVFKHLYINQNYEISVIDSAFHPPVGTVIILSDKNGKKLKTFIQDKEHFHFKTMEADKNLLMEMIVDDVELSVKLTGYIYDSKKQPLAGVTVKLSGADEAGNQLTITGVNGAFVFTDSRASKINALEVLIKDTTETVLYIADKKGSILRKLEKNNGVFKYKLIAADISYLGEFSVSDPWLQVSQIKTKQEALVIIENIFYETNSYKFNTEGEKILNKAVQVLKSNPKLYLEIGSHTDSRANDSFNLTLSNKRAKYAADYIISKGINAKQVLAVGYGETKPLNRCTNGVTCSDSEMAVNRRTEFKLIEK